MAQLVAVKAASDRQNTANVQNTPEGTANVALLASPGAYSQTEDQKIRDLVNDLRAALINKGIIA